MKWLFIIFLLANFIYFGWELNSRLGHVSEAPPPLEPIASGSEELRLLRELDELPPRRETGYLSEDQTTEEIEIDATNGENVPDDPAVAAIAETMDPAPTAEEIETNDGQAQSITESGQEISQDSGPPVESQLIESSKSWEGPSLCWSVGPLKAEKDVEMVKNSFIGPTQIRRRDEVQGEIKRFWVYLEPQDSEEQARAKLEDLKTRGVEDYMLVSTGDLKNAISLGLFSSQEAVNRRLAQLSKEGLQPVVVPRHRQKLNYWLDIKAPEDMAMPELPNGAKFESVNCDDISEEE